MNSIVCFYIASNLTDTLTAEICLWDKANDVHCAFKTRKRKDWTGKHELGDFCLLDLFALAGWLVFGTGKCCLETWSLKKELSAGECGVKPRGFGLGFFFSALCLLHQHMCSVNPWPSQCHSEYLPPAWCGLMPVHCGFWSGTVEIIPPGTRSHHNTHITNVSMWVHAAVVCVCCWLLLHAHSVLQRRLCSIPSSNLLFVCVCMVTCGHSVLCNTGIHMFMISPSAFNTITCHLVHGQNPNACQWLMGKTSSHAIKPHLPPPSSSHSSHLLQYLPLLSMWRHAHILWANDWFLIVYILDCTPWCRCLCSALHSACIYTGMHRQTETHSYNRDVLMPKIFIQEFLEVLTLLAQHVLIASKWRWLLLIGLLFSGSGCVFGHVGEIVHSLESVYIRV